MKRILTAGIMALILLIVSSCNLPTKDAPIELLPTQAPIEVAQPATLVPMEAVPPPLPTAEPEIVHITMPALGTGDAQTIHDQVSRETAPEKRAYGGDEYVNGRYERPFMTEGMEYLPYIDIKQTNLIRDEEDGWLYVNIVVMEPPSKSGGRKVIYGIEVDSDLDGRGDVLILADAPTSSEWTTDGVRIWEDVNANVGDRDPMRPNAPMQEDGFEIQVFDEGRGYDADLAWVRQSSDTANSIEIAFKFDLVDSGEEEFVFLWGAWAFAEDAHPDWFDHHDRFTLEEAGSPLIENEHYPLKAFYAVDNTCRALSGQAPISRLPGMCPVSVPQGGDEGDEPPGSCVEIECCPGDYVCYLYWDPNLCTCVSELN